MKFVKQFGIILLITFIGEVLHALLPIPVPAGIYGIVLLFLGLKTRLIPVSEVKEATFFILQIMPIRFIPDTWDILAPSWIQFLVVTVVTTIFVMAVSGLVTQAVIRARKRKEKKA